MHALKSVGLFDKSEIADMNIYDTNAFLARAFPDGKVTDGRSTCVCVFACLCLSALSFKLLLTSS